MILLATLIILGIVVGALARFVPDYAITHPFLGDDD